MCMAQVLKTVLEKFIEKHGSRDILVHSPCSRQDQPNLHNSWQTHRYNGFWWDLPISHISSIAHERNELFLLLKKKKSLYFLIGIFSFYNLKALFLVPPTRDIQDNLLPSIPIFCVAEDLLCLYSIFSFFIQTTNSYQLLSYCYLPDNLKQSSIGPIPHKGAVLQTERNR